MFKPLTVVNLFYEQRKPPFWGSTARQGGIRMTYPMAGDPTVCDRELQLALDRYWDTPDDDDEDEEEE